MIDASKLHDTVTYFESFGSIMRMILDFNSYKTAGSSPMAFMTNSAKRDAGLQGVPSKTQRLEAGK